MAISEKNHNHGRQYALIGLQEVLGTEMEAAEFDVMSLPADSIIIGGAVIVTEAFDATVTGTIGGAGTGASTGAVDMTVVARTDIVFDGSVNTLGAAVTMTGSGVSVAGSAYVEVEYIRVNRANEMQE